MNKQRTTRRIACLALYTSMATQVACSPSDPGHAISEIAVVEVNDLGALAQDDNLRGRDGGYSGPRDGRMVWVFGDTVTIAANIEWIILHSYIEPINR